MEQLVRYFKNPDWYIAIDAGVFIAFLVIVSVFFCRKRNYRIGLFVVLYALIIVGVDVCIGIFELDKLFFTREILRWFGLMCIVSAAVVYQSDLKMLFAKIGGKSQQNVYAKVHDSTSEDDLRHTSGEIVKACQSLAKNNIGALIVICPTVISSTMLDTGTRLDCNLSASVLESIFNTHAPLHDGAVIVKNNTILAAGCFLPLSQNPTISKELGTRHRAAIGITEESDVLTIVVSEETGIISLVQNGEIKRYVTGEKLMDAIDDAFGITDISRRKTRNFTKGYKR